MTKRILTSLLLLNITIVALGQTTAMTYNIRYNNPEDKENWWEHRKNEVAQLINFYQPTILGVQEALNNQVVFLDSNLSGYQYVGVGREDGNTKGEYAPIFYDTTKVSLIKTKTYWLSDTPEKVSVGWDAAMERITTFAHFKEKNTGQDLYVFNCHYDHLGEQARIASSKLILKLIHALKIEGERVVVMGDLNASPEQPPITILIEELEDAYRNSEKVYGPFGTYNAFNLTHPLDRRIDYILTKNLKPKTYRTIDDRRANLLYPSDHLPILIQF
ncbi:endonuclease/exonuclease/phosphatase family protein [Flavobacterium sp. ASW18X]|uniref:endonuclease/exonuclease/phosphatase family protein n=1 Tax=Flavobacterium sp. ASW18X TaxID=2572595 RepID=UPI0010ADB403|nr:endonuclease/exonuclease/phosphatase family protein [Flavobacterium sp. ASW18X]TKD62457.1 endonuclease/exonuclease/phosphatase family protein [Flavobacterium sp. ASW18X]